MHTISLTNTYKHRSQKTNKQKILNVIVCLHLLYNCRNALFDPLLYVCRFIVLCAPYDNKLSDKVTEPNENDERVQEVDKPPDPAVHVT